jgi:MFS transporter, CP family, cyanate transporter
VASGKTAVGQAAGDARRGAIGAGGALVAFALVLLVGVNLRAPLLSVPPLLAQIQHDLALDYTATGVLSALPTLVMGLGAWPAGRIGARIGGRAAVGWGMALVAAATLLRGVFPGVITLYLFTGAMAAGVALGQTSIPMLARQWFPSRIGLVSALFTDGLTLGETIAAAATYPLMRAWFGPDAWPAALLVWAIPAALTMVLWLWLAPPDPNARRAREVAAAPEAARVTGAAHAEHADHADHTARSAVGPWLIGGVMGAGSLIYFGMNNWIAPYNVAIHAAAMTPLALFAINIAQLPVTIGLTPIMGRLVGRRWPLIVAGCVAIVAVAGWLWTPASLEPLWGALMGASSAGVFTFSIAMPALYGHDANVARLTGASLMVSYTAAFTGPFIGGALWDAFGLPALALLPVGVAALTLLILPPLLPRWRHGQPAPRA